MKKILNYFLCLYIAIILAPAFLYANKPHLDINKHIDKHFIAYHNDYATLDKNLKNKNLVKPIKEAFVARFSNIKILFWTMIYC